MTYVLKHRYDCDIFLDGHGDFVHETKGNGMEITSE